MEKVGVPNGARHRSGIAPDLLILLSAILGALALRILPAWPWVFPGGLVRFRGIDSWYHMRRADVLARHFPAGLEVDPYGLFPAGQPPAAAPLFDLLLGGIAFLLGGGRPSQELVDTSGAVLPAVLGALVVIPVYFLGRMMLDRWSGALAALLVALLPGEFLKRSLLGFTDHHVAETLLAALCLLAVASAARQDPSRRGRRLATSVLAGIVLGLYLLTWIGGAFLVLVLCVWAAVQITADHLGRRSPAPAVLIPCLAVAAVIVIPFSLGMPYARLHTAALILGALGVAALVGLSLALSRAGAARWVFPAGALLAGLASVGIISMASPGLFDLLAWPVRHLASGGGPTVMEMKPFLQTGGWASLWKEYGFAWLLAPAGLVLASLRGWRLGEADKLLVAVAGVVCFAATAAAIRFSYYLVLPMALLGGYLLARVLGASGVLETSGAGFRGRAGQLLIVAALFFLLVVPNLRPAITLARVQSGPSDDWVEALGWMSRSTPEPFGDAGAYLELPSGEGAGTDALPEPSWSVMAWCDTGYWITRIGRRVPVANPTHSGAGAAGRFLTETDPVTGRHQLDRLRAGAVVLDISLPLWDDHGRLVGKLSTIAPWVERSLDRYVETVVATGGDGARRPVRVFHPDYYRTMLARLFLYDGRAAVPDDSTWIATTADGAAGPDGPTVDLRRFSTYDEARAFIEATSAPGARVVGLDPWRTCVPLEPVSGVRLAYASPRTAELPGGGEIAAIKIFEVTPLPSPRRAVCHRARSAVIIDGRLDEEAWKAAAWTGPFVDIEGALRHDPPLSTRVTMLWDDEHLYIAAEMEEPHVRATLTERDAVIFHDNDFEVFLDPDGDGDGYVEIEINALNTVWDLLLVRPYRDGGPALNEFTLDGLRTAVHVDGTLNDPSDRDRGWTVEMAIPWKDLAAHAGRPLPPREGDRWRVNFSRVEWDHRITAEGYETIAGRDEHNWVWSPQGVVDMHLPERWGIVTFTQRPAAEP